MTTQTQNCAHEVARSLLSTYNPITELSNIWRGAPFIKTRPDSMPEAFMDYWHEKGARTMWRFVTEEMKTKTAAELGEIIECAEGLSDSLDGTSDRTIKPSATLKRQIGLMRGFAGGNESNIPRPFGLWNGITILRYYASLTVMVEIMKYCDEHTARGW